MKNVLSVLFICALLFGLHAHATTLEYGGQISQKSQDPWTLRNHNALSQIYNVRVTIESPLVARLDVKSKYEVDPCYSQNNNYQFGERDNSVSDRSFCEGGNNDYSPLPPSWITNETAQLGRLTVQVWKLEKNSSQVLVAEKTLPISVYGYELGKDLIRFGRVNFYVGNEADIELPSGETLQIFGYFGQTTTPLIVSGTNKKPTVSIMLPGILKPTWQIQGADANFYAGTLSLRQIM